MPKVWVVMLCSSGKQEKFYRELTSEISFVAAQRRGSDKDMAEVHINHQPCISVVHCYSSLCRILYAEKVGGDAPSCFHLS